MVNIGCVLFEPTPLSSCCSSLGFNPPFSLGNHRRVGGCQFWVGNVRV